MSCNTLFERLGTSSILDSFKLSKLKRAFPKVWVKQIRNTNCNPIATEVSEGMFEISNCDLIKLSLMKAKHFYILLNEFKKENPPVSLFWQEILQLPINFEWRHVLDFKLKRSKTTE